MAKKLQVIGNLSSSKSAQPDWSVNDESDPAYVKNRTHYEIPPKFDIRWDGDTTDKFVFDMSTLGYEQGYYFVKVSDLVPTVEDVVGATLSLNDGRLGIIPLDEIDQITYPGAYTVVGYLIIVQVQIANQPRWCISFDEYSYRSKSRLYLRPPCYDRSLQGRRQLANLRHPVPRP